MPNPKQQTTLACDDASDLGRSACACAYSNAGTCIMSRGGEPDERCECACHKDDEDEDAY